ncbi:hypothetical protein [Sinorhizobium meliloti]|uniref:hypothetical protein n=1 Tax=Rhizobium meliloti TaxID=382 RepID=UPI0004870DF3|nr:hypothetical protein [Sinorhizobium meliloti]
MGRMKEMMLEREGNLALAADYLVQKGVLEKCEHHGEIFGGGYWDLEPEFWRNGMADRNRGASGPVPWAAEMEAREYTDLLKEAYEDHSGDGCGYCAKNMAD